MKRMLVAVAVAAAMGLAGAEASANCASPVTYEVQVDGNDVTVLPRNFEERECGASETLLRESVETGEVVAIPTCMAYDDHGAELSVWVDSCVPAGTYRYGLLEPYECSSGACSTDYHAEAEVVGDPASGCEAATEATTVGLPWGSSQTVCTYGADLSGDSDTDDGGCSLAPGGATTVFGINALALLAGLVMMRRRRCG